MKMQMFRKVRMTIVADVILVLLIACGVVVYAALPWLLEWYFAGTEVYAVKNIFYTIMGLMYTAGIPAIVLLVLALRLMLNITKGESFVRKNAKLLGKMGLCALVISVLFLGVSLIIHSLFAMVVGVVFLLLSVLAKVFRDLFTTAIDYKEENELTI